MSSGETAPPLNDLLKVLNDLEFKAKHESETSFKLAFDEQFGEIQMKLNDLVNFC